MKKLDDKLHPNNKIIIEEVNPNELPKVWEILKKKSKELSAIDDYTETPKIFYDKLLEKLNLINPQEKYRYNLHIKGLQRIPNYSLRLI